ETTSWSSAIAPAFALPAMNGPSTVIGTSCFAPVHGTAVAGVQFRHATQRDQIVGFVDRERIDLLVAAPLARIGMEGGGTLDEIAAFVALLADVQRRAQQPVTVVLVHHQNRAGQVSGAWEGL